MKSPGRKTLFLFLSLFPFSLLLAQPPNLSTNEWLEDLNTLERLIRDHHPAPFRAQDETAFSVAAQEAGANIRKKNTGEAKLAALLELIASLGDGHSALRSRDRYRCFGYLPFTVRWFGEALHLTRIEEQHAAAVGGKLLSIDGLPIATVVERLRTVVPHANDSRFKKFSPYYLHLPGLLHALNITRSPQRATLEVETLAGEQRVFLIERRDQEAAIPFVELETDSATLPLYRRNSDQPYWFEYLEAEKLLYLKYDRVTTTDEENIWSFSERLFRVVEEKEIDKFVVDIRHNGGGSSAYSAPLWHGIEKSGKINQPGKLFVITGHDTFSAAITFACYLEMRTHAIFVGEAVCDYPNHPGDAEAYTLPNSGLHIYLSRLFNESSFYLDERTTLPPDFTVETTLQDYLQNSDPAMDFIRFYKHSNPPRAVSEAAYFAGKYAFSPYQYLNIQKGPPGLRMEISGEVFSPLYPVGKGRFQTEIQGLELSFTGSGDLIVRYPDGKLRQLPRVESAPPTPYGLLGRGQFQKAEEMLQSLKANHPDVHFWRDHMLAQLALEIYYEKRAAYGREKASETARAILEMAIRLNPENHSYAKAALRYY